MCCDCHRNHSAADKLLQMQPTAGLYLWRKEWGIQWQRQWITFVTSEKCEREKYPVCEGEKMARYNLKERAIPPPWRLVTKGSRCTTSFPADKSACAKRGDRLAVIVLPGEGADSGVKGAIKVEWVRKGDLLVQMKKGLDHTRYWPQPDEMNAPWMAELSTPQQLCDHNGR